jgi:ABC-type transporter Mla maintaining outer membrane lipid asymmetry ATPase subunit MlaF
MSDIISDLINKFKEYLHVTHDPKSEYKIADRIMMLYKRASGPGEARDTKNEYVKQFVEGSRHGPVIANRTFEMERI